MSERAQLRPGYSISRIIKGGWQLAGGHGAFDRRQAIADMTRFFDAGITTFDCADIYTGVEEMIGEFIADLRSQRGGDAADQVQVHTKLVPDFDRLDTVGSSRYRYFFIFKIGGEQLQVLFIIVYDQNFRAD